MADQAATATFDLTPPTQEQFDNLVADLDDEERHVLLEHGTEAPFCGVFLAEKRPGVFTCRLCGLPLFHGGTKFESGTGWRTEVPSSSDAIPQHEVLDFRLLGPQPGFVVVGELFEGLAHLVVGQQRRQAPASFDLFD